MDRSYYRWNYSKDLLLSRCVLQNMPEVLDDSRRHGQRNWHSVLKAFNSKLDQPYKQYRKLKEHFSKLLVDHQQQKALGELVENELIDTLDAILLQRCENESRIKRRKKEERDKKLQDQTLKLMKLHSSSENDHSTPVAAAAAITTTVSSSSSSSVIGDGGTTPDLPPVANTNSDLSALTIFQKLLSKPIEVRISNSLSNAAPQIENYKDLEKRLDAIEQNLKSLNSSLIIQIDSIKSEIKSEIEHQFDILRSQLKNEKQ
ncbi:uncharacterized protein ASCRUDRAFT_113289 [Ascoidea rubescens DSM 1968]|uniref:Uncharacterized protein n=1 Tax=Ascoidea rubescens DSM 1968 TaxID=1344418 RepID=A0A1D2VBZ6_9ASCO|nr:hypothetical protein ASCRUDRAFT_113289 [Ascoidea rubescens DSM 1968]ODV59149.1 hypothetical protein ASCRUDRAFT_113289 [Ascoidea rubescens DSM 1968]